MGGSIVGDMYIFYCSLEQIFIIFIKKLELGLYILEYKLKIPIILDLILEFIVLFLDNYGL